jgi:hypothetical protein
LASLNNQADVDAMKTMVSGMEQMRGWSTIRTGLETAIDEFNQRGDAGARKIITFFADGPPTNRGDLGGAQGQYPAPLKPTLDALGVKVYMMIVGAFEYHNDIPFYEPILASINDLYPVFNFDSDGYHTEIFAYAALPEPATLSLLAIAGAATLARRKRRNL